MTTEEVIRKVLLDKHADVLRESLKLLVRELMELEVSELVERRAARKPHCVSQYPVNASVTFRVPNDDAVSGSASH